MKLPILLLLLVFCASFSLKKNQEIEPIKNQLGNNDDFILWDPAIKLKWSDFQGKIDTNVRFKASTATNIKVKSYISKQETFSYEIACLFQKKISWTKNQESIKLLNHEQLHFDIAELATRNMRKQILNYDFKKNPSVKEGVKKILSETMEVRDSIDEIYDSETKHGIVELKQKKWETYVASELKKIAQYAPTKVVINLK